MKHIILPIIEAERRAIVADDDVYRMNGFSGRDEYLATLCQEYDPDAVYTLADLLGENEDFDGLISSLEDYTDFGFY